MRKRGTSAAFDFMALASAWLVWGCGGKTTLDADPPRGEPAVRSGGTGAAPANPDQPEFGGSQQASGGAGARSAGSGGAGARGALGGAAGAPSAPGGGAGASSGQPGAGGSGTGSTAGTSSCGGLLIDDLESGSGHICDTDGRAGVWYAFNDESGTQWPELTTPGVPIPTSVIPGGRNDSARAMYTAGEGFSWWGAGIGLDLAFDGVSYGLYDASAYDGITFWARGLPGSSIVVRVSTESTTYLDWGGSCNMEPCNPAYFEVFFSAEWSEYFVPFDALSGLERDRVTNIQFLEWNHEPFEFWIDDLAFFIGPPGCCAADCEGTIVVDGALAEKLGGATECTEVCYHTRVDASNNSGDAGVSSIAGVECLPGLVWFAAPRNTIRDLAPLGSLRVLTRIDLSDNEVEDLSPLSGLHTLTLVNLARNAIRDLAPLGDSTGMLELDLSDNAIVDLGPLAGMTGLTTLDLSGNAITDLTPLAGMTALTTLDLSGNAITDLTPLAGLTELATLDLSGNAITDITPLARMTRLTGLDLSENAVEHLGPLAGLTELTTLDLSANTVADLTPVTWLTRLTSLDLSGNQIGDLGALAGLTPLVHLDLADNGIVDVGPLAGLSSLAGLELSDNQVSALAPLSRLAALRTLGLARNRISALEPLSGVAALARLDLTENSVSDVTPLAGLVELLILDLTDNLVPTLSPFLTFAGLKPIHSRYATEYARLIVSGNPLDCAAEPASLAALREAEVQVTTDCP